MVKFAFPPATMSFIGPELPSHLINPKKSDKNSEKGPQIPPHVVPQQSTTLNIYDDEDDDDDGPKPAGPSIPAEFLKVSESLIDDDSDDDGPELPPHLNKGSRKEAGPSIHTPPGPSTGKRQVGPTFPTYAPTYDPTTYHNNEDDDDDDDDFGPKPLPAGMQHQQTDAVKEFIEREEKRRKLAEVCANAQNLFFLSCSAFFENRMQLNPKPFNETNGCSSHHHLQVFSEVSSVLLVSNSFILKKYKHKHRPRSN